MTDPVRVQLVEAGGPNWIAIGALIVSVISLGLTLWFRFDDGLRLKADFTTDGRKVLIRNMSRTLEAEVYAVRLERISWRGSRPKTVNVRLETLSNHHVRGKGNGLPFTLGVGKREQLLRVDQHGREVAGSVFKWARESPGGARWVRAVVEHGHGTKRGRWVRVVEMLADSQGASTAS